MQTQTIKTELSINGQKVIIGHQFLEEISSYIPDIPQNNNIFEILANSNNSEVRRDMTRNDNLNKKTVKILLADQNDKIVEYILNNEDAAKYITKKQIFKIIAKNNIKHLCTIASNLDDFIKCNGCKLANIFSKHENPLVRYAIVQCRVNDIVSTKVLERLSRDKDIDVAKEAKESLKYRTGKIR